MNKVFLGSAVALALTAGVSTSANAALAAGSTLQMGAQTYACNYDLGTAPDGCLAGTYPTGNYFAMDTSSDGVLGTDERTEIVAGAVGGGLTLDAVQAAGDIDATWFFFGPSGNHTADTAITVTSDDGAGNVTLDMSGWRVFWNNTNINMGTGADAVVTCGNTCEDGDTYTLDYNAYVPDDGATNFGNVFYGVHLSGTISSVPVPAAVWLFGSGLVGLAGVARRRKAA